MRREIEKDKEEEEEEEEEEDEGEIVYLVRAMEEATGFLEYERWVLPFSKLAALLSTWALKSHSPLMKSRSNNLNLMEWLVKYHFRNNNIVDRRDRKYGWLVGWLVVWWLA
ncbi:hypothetical protein M0802_010738 [Mischocyttarus mexicanus]|nr:hypothetical protein M0802_010738 [Mischocyttarus mexicanus]